MPRPPRPLTLRQIRLEMARIARDMRSLASLWEDHLPGEMRLHTRALADRMDRLIDRLPIGKSEAPPR